MDDFGAAMVAERVRRAVAGALAERGLADGPVPADLTGLGLRSVEYVNLMLALEAEFDIAFARSDLEVANFSNLARIESLVRAALTRRRSRSG